MSGLLAEWKRGWPLVACGCIGTGLTAAIPGLTGVVMAPIMEQEGWSRATVAAGTFILSVTGLFMAPILDRMVKRFGVGNYSLFCTIFLVFALALLGYGTISQTVWFAAWTVVGLFLIGIGPVIWSTAILSHFVLGRGLALAVTLAGGGLGLAVFGILGALIQESNGWRAVYGMLALTLLLVQLPLTYFVFRYMRASATRTAQSGTSQARHAVAPFGWSFKEAIGMRHFWQMLAICLLVAVCEGGLMIHLFPILTEGGMAVPTAAAILSTMGASLVAGRICTGFLLDRGMPTIIFAVSIAFILIACIIALRYDGSFLIGCALALGIGVGSGGTTTAIAFLTARYFGTQSYPAIFGVLFGLFGLGYGAAPMVVGHLRDGMTSYAPLFGYFIALLMVAIGLVLLLGRASALPTVSTTPARAWGSISAALRNCSIDKSNAG